MHFLYKNPHAILWYEDSFCLVFCEDHILGSLVLDSSSHSPYSSVVFSSLLVDEFPIFFVPLSLLFSEFFSVSFNIEPMRLGIFLSVFFSLRIFLDNLVVSISHFSCPARSIARLISIDTVTTSSSISARASSRIIVVTPFLECLTLRTYTTSIQYIGCKPDIFILNRFLECFSLGNSLIVPRIWCFRSFVLLVEFPSWWSIIWSSCWHIGIWLSEIFKLLIFTPLRRKHEVWYDSPKFRELVPCGVVGVRIELHIFL
jgi:hypothetical protein